MHINYSNWWRLPVRCSYFPMFARLEIIPFYNTSGWFFSRGFTWFRPLVAQQKTSHSSAVRFRKSRSWFTENKFIDARLWSSGLGVVVGAFVGLGVGSGFLIRKNVRWNPTNTIHQLEAPGDVDFEPTKQKLNFWWRKDLGGKNQWYF